MLSRITSQLCLRIWNQVVDFGIELRHNLFYHLIDKEQCVEKKLTGIHGTTNLNASKILACNKFIPSSARSTRTFGEGVYFFDEAGNGISNAHLWAKEKCKQKKYRNMDVKPAMLSVLIVYDDAKAIDFDDHEFRKMYEDAKADLLAKNPEMKNNNHTKTQIIKRILDFLHKKNILFDIVLGTASFYGDGTPEIVIPISGRGCAVKNNTCIQMDTCRRINFI